MEAKPNIVNIGQVFVGVVFFEGQSADLVAVVAAATSKCIQGAPGVVGLII